MMYPVVNTRKYGCHSDRGLAPVTARVLNIKHIHENEQAAGKIVLYTFSENKE